MAEEKEEKNHRMKHHTIRYDMKLDDMIRCNKISDDATKWDAASFNNWGKNEWIDKSWQYSKYWIVGWIRIKTLLYRKIINLCSYPIVLEQFLFNCYHSNTKILSRWCDKFSKKCEMTNTFSPPTHPLFLTSTKAFSQDLDLKIQMWKYCQIK